MANIVLTTLNARYIHSAFGLRYLIANMGELQAQTEIVEFTINQRATEIAEHLLVRQPRIIGLGVYIWNVSEISAVVAILKQVAPEILIVLGGPEVSHPPDLPDLADLADYVITGPGEQGFAGLCQQLLNGTPPSEKLIAGNNPALDALKLPYDFYSDTDIRQRIVYVEASRGCPFKCEFCLSSLDQTAKAFSLQAFLQAMDKLYQRGTRHFKFIDRTFNLKVDTSVAIMEFFLERLTPDLYLHFEVIPDHLPARLKLAIAKFPAGTLQFEIGIQSFDTEVQQRISRKQDNQKSAENLRWLRQHSQAHIHADLIVGLPGDTLEGFGRSFDQLYALRPQEIQVGILKRLRGAPINRHNDAYQLRYDPNPPYTILSTRDMDFATLQRLNRFARFWDLIGNSGRFPNSLPLILAKQPFARFLQTSDAIYTLTDSTWQIALKRLFELLLTVMTDSLAIPSSAAIEALEADYIRTGEKSKPAFLIDTAINQKSAGKANKRQQQILAS